MSLLDRLASGTVWEVLVVLMALAWLLVLLRGTRRR